MTRNQWTCPLDGGSHSLVNDDIRAELLAMKTADQEVAQECWRISESDERFQGRFLFETEVQRSDWPEVFLEADRLTDQHSVRLGRIVDVHGWPGSALVGSDGAEAAWLILQHSGAELQERCLPLLRSALDHGDALPQQYASVADRLELLCGRVQRYGTISAWTVKADTSPLGGWPIPGSWTRLGPQSGSVPGRPTSRAWEDGQARRRLPADRPGTRRTLGQPPPSRGQRKIC